MSQAIYDAIVQSATTLRANHGSTRRDRCNNPNCEMNRGGEAHTLSINSYRDFVNKRYDEIMRNQKGEK